MTDGFGEGSKIEVGIVLMLDIVVGHIGMAKAVNSYIMSQTNLLADLPMALAGTAADATAEGEIGRATNVFMFPADGIVFLLDDSLCGLLLRACIVKFCLSQFLCHPLIDDFGLFIELFAEHLQINFKKKLRS